MQIFCNSNRHFLPLEQKKKSIHTTMWWHQILEEFFFKSMSPMHKYTQSSCRSVNRALRDRQARYPSILPSEFDQISSANTRMPNACRNRHTGKLLNPQLLPLPSLSAPPNDIVSFLISQPRFPFQSCVCVPPVAAAAAGWP